jgi:hypothetical protein
VKANYFEYNKLYAQELCGRALTNERISAATEVLRKYLADGGGSFLSERFDIGVRTWERDGKVQKCRFVYMNSGKELSMNEIKNIGMFLRGGPCYGQ